MRDSIVYNEDCMHFMSRCENDHFDLAVVDPPYGINAPNMSMGTNKNRTKGGYAGESVASKLKKGRLNKGSGKLNNRILNNADINWDYEPPPPEYFEELFRVSSNQVIWGGNYFDLPPTRCIICWDKIQQWVNFSQWEMAWTSFDKPAKMYRISNTGGNNNETKIHPTQKPVRLYDKIFADFAEPGMRILDTHLGSGSSRISANKAGLSFTGCEIDKEYYEAQEKRYLQFISQLRMF